MTKEELIEELERLEPDQIALVIERDKEGEIGIGAHDYDPKQNTIEEIVNGLDPEAEILGVVVYSREGEVKLFRALRILEGPIPNLLIIIERALRETSKFISGQNPTKSSGPGF